jgi:hypothetical protein
VGNNLTEAISQSIHQDYYPNANFEGLAVVFCLSPHLNWSCTQEKREKNLVLWYNNINHAKVLLQAMSNKSTPLVYLWIKHYLQREPIHTSWSSKIVKLMKAPDAGNLWSTEKECWGEWRTRYRNLRYAFFKFVTGWFDVAGSYTKCQLWRTHQQHWEPQHSSNMSKVHYPFKSNCVLPQPRQTTVASKAIYLHKY